MERSKAKEAGRKKVIREKAEALKEKPPRKAPSKELIKKAGRYRAIETAKKQLIEARQAVVPDQDQQPYTAVDKVETYATDTAHEVLRAVPSVGKASQNTDNPFHGETDSVSSEWMPYRARRTAYFRRFHGRKWHHIEQSRTTASPAITKKKIIKEQGRRLARSQAIQEIKSGATKKISRHAKKASGNLFTRLGTAVAKAVTPSKEILLYAAGAFVLILLPFLFILSLGSLFEQKSGERAEASPLSEAVEEYTPLIRVYAEQYGISEYEDLIKAVMMQESGGQGSDPMQCSECGFNTRFPHYPNAITDPEYSVAVGIQNLADCLRLSNVESPTDLDRISLALQGYNYGSGYISWALANYSGYSELNAIEFSEMMAAQNGSSGYGDKDYVAHVLRYYPQV